MPVWIRSMAGLVRTRLPTFLTLGILGGLACWGSLNDWKLPGSSKEELGADHSQAIIQITTDTISSGNHGSNSTAKRLNFPSAETVKKAGIRVVAVEVRRMTRYVIANGMIDYEPSLYARLTARAAGTVWRVDKEIGNWVEKGDVLALIDAVEV